MINFTLCVGYTIGAVLMWCAVVNQFVAEGPLTVKIAYFIIAAIFTGVAIYAGKAHCREWKANIIRNERN